MNGDTPVQPAASQPQAPPPVPRPVPQPQPPAEPETTWRYAAASSTAAPASVAPTAPYTPGPQAATWSASEFIDHNKSLGWYMSLAGITLLIDVILYFWTHDFISIGAVSTMAVLLGVMGSRKPRVLDYQLDASGLSIGGTFHPYGEFKSFAIMEDGILQSITFLPLKRFLPPISVFYAPEDQDKIIDVLGQHLPMELHTRDAVDRFTRRIRL